MSKQALENVTNSLKGNKEILMKKKIVSLGKNYTVMNSSHNPLCYVRLNWGSNVGGALVSNYMGKWAGRMMNYTYTVNDESDQTALEIKKGGGSWSSNFDVREPESGEHIGIIQFKRSFLIGGMRARWVDPKTEQVLITTQGNVIRRKYKMMDGSGREIAKVRHKIAAVRDVWKLEVFSGNENLHAVIFATVLDFEKEM
jgi:uncharacterized protein YxjI